MRPFVFLLAALVVTSGMSPTAASQPIPAQTALLQSPSPAQGDSFGFQVALTSSTAFVSSNGPGIAGSVFVYNQTASGAWAFTTTLRPGTTSDVGFGGAISASGDRVAISAAIEVSTFVRRGVTYLFRRNAQTGAWEQEARLVPAESEPNDAFGSSVSLDGDQLAVGAPLVGAAYVFAVSTTSGQWVQRARIFGPSSADSRFGSDVGIEDGLLVASAPLEGYNNTAANGGAVYVYRRSADTWTQETNLVRQPVAGQRVRSFALRDGVVLVTRPNGSGSTNNTVAAYRFSSTAGGWFPFGSFTVPAQNGSGFGSRMAISATGRVLVGAGLENGGIGAAYVFEPDAASGSYMQTARLVAADRASGDAFGSRVAVWGDTYLVGAPGRGEGGVGAAFVFEAPRPPPPPSEVQIVHASGAILGLGRLEVYLNQPATSTTPDAVVGFFGGSTFLAVPAGQPLNVRVRPVVPPPAPGPREYTLTSDPLASGRYVVNLAGIPEELLAQYAPNPSGVLQRLRLHAALLEALFPREAPLAGGVPVVVSHAVTDAPALDVVVAETGQTLADDLPYGQAGPPTTLPAGTHRVEVRDAATGALVTAVRFTLDGTETAFPLLIGGFLNPSANQNGPALALTATDETGASDTGVVVTGTDETPVAGLALSVQNPARGSVAVRYTLPAAGPARVAVVDALGRQVAVLSDGVHAAGPHEALLNARELAPGVYVLRLEGTGERLFRTVTVVR
ncbi:MAG TPA: DUF4397 domain-containing protein [Rubricoccaceae bacterium]|jgi:hypothetical protein